MRLFEALLTDPTRHRYGYDLSRETGLASGTLYPILMRLAAQHLLDAGWEPSDEPGLAAPAHLPAHRRRHRPGQGAAGERGAQGPARHVHAEGGLMRRVTRAVLAAAVRGRGDRGGPWSEAVLAEFDQTTGRWEGLRWAVGGLRAVWYERRARTAVRIPRPRPGGGGRRAGRGVRAQPVRALRAVHGQRLDGADRAGRGPLPAGQGELPGDRDRAR
nr:hypothetical protein GCM10020092_069370 [Actinoplanes digitatis]